MTSSVNWDNFRFFLTYPQSDFDNNELLDALAQLGTIEWARACREQHEDGQPHSHVVIKYRERIRTRDCRFFDVRGRHPKVEAVRSLPKALAYCTKEGSYTDRGTVPKSAGKRAADDEEEWATILEAAKGDELDWCKTMHSCRVQQHVAKRVRELSMSQSVDLDEYDGRPIGESLQRVPKEFQSLLVVGPPGCGKTGWAMREMPRPVLLVKHIDTLRYFRPGYHKSILFDDCEFAHLPRPTQLQLCDFENQCQVHLRYQVAVIPARVPRLFLCNPGCEPFMTDTAIQGRRLQSIYL